MREAGVRQTLIPALIVFSTAVCVFLVIALAIDLSAAVTALDTSVATWLHVRATPLVSNAMAAVSFLGAPTTLTVVAVAGSLLLVYQRRRAEAATLSTAVLGGNFLNFCLKHLIQRGRPVFDDPIFSLPTYSFPSGHAMASAVFYGLLAIYASVNAKQRYAAKVAIAGAVFMVALVSFSRVYLGLHYLSDVIGGIAEGIAWLALSLTVLRYIRRGEAGAGVHTDR
ncbi:MAG TPA: phosphatase PAP2 family protein [Casimicrobiaceae bacterium]|jgi:membrane-associated phospholipid phosphatase|nr:phosphatase PAP2 family protein [Casimicrobiaceae bacterium]